MKRYHLNRTVDDLEEASKAGSVLGRLSMEKMGGKQAMLELASMGGKAYWGNLSPRERHVEQKRRAMVRKKNQQARLKAALERFK